MMAAGHSFCISEMSQRSIEIPLASIAGKKLWEGSNRLSGLICHLSNLRRELLDPIIGIV